jgi:hypothetical protein
LIYLPDQEFLYLHWNMLLLAPPTICPAGSLRMNGCQGWRLKEPELDETPQDSVGEEILAAACL